jgi:hypothetical protein
LKNLATHMVKNNSFIQQWLSVGNKQESSSKEYWAKGNTDILQNLTTWPFKVCRSNKLFLNETHLIFSFLDPLNLGSTKIDFGPFSEQHHQLTTIYYRELYSFIKCFVLLLRFDYYIYNATLKELVVMPNIFHLKKHLWTLIN